MKLRVYPICGHYDYTDFLFVCFVNAWADPISPFEKPRQRYIFFVSLQNAKFFTEIYYENDIMRVEQLEPAKSKIDKALVHQLEYLLGDKFIKIRTKNKRKS